MRIKALLATFGASFDDMVRKIENHEAVADCVIQEVRESAARIRSQLNISQARTSKLQQKEKQLEVDCVRWRERALSCRDTDEEKALRCIQSLKHSQRTLENLRLQLSENQNLSADLETHLFNVEQKLSEIQGKKESLSARSARNKVESYALRNLDVSANEGIFDRWETQVMTDEYRTTAWSPSTSGPSDSLDREFRNIEDREALLLELSDLEKDDAKQKVDGA